MPPCVYPHQRLVLDSAGNFNGIEWKPSFQGLQKEAVAVHEGHLDGSAPVLILELQREIAQSADRLCSGCKRHRVQATAGEQVQRRPAELVRQQLPRRGVLLRGICTSAQDPVLVGGEGKLEANLNPAGPSDAGRKAGAGEEERIIIPD